MMKRQLPTVLIEGTTFYVDVLKDELREKSDPLNRIPFSVFDQEGNGYTFLYDTTRKNIPENRKALKHMEPHFKWVTLPALMELDPEGIAIRYNIPLEVLCPELADKGSEKTEEDDDGEEELYSY